MMDLTALVQSSLATQDLKKYIFLNFRYYKLHYFYKESIMGKNVKSFKGNNSNNDNVNVKNNFNNNFKENLNKQANQESRNKTNQDCQYNNKEQQNGGWRNNQNTYQEKMDKEVRTQFDKYSKLSQNQLMEEFYKEAERQKRMGNLNNEMLENFYAMMSPNMTKEQREKMRVMINAIK